MAGDNLTIVVNDEENMMVVNNINHMAVVTPPPLADTPLAKRCRGWMTCILDSTVGSSNAFTVAQASRGTSQKLDLERTYRDVYAIGNRMNPSSWPVPDGVSRTGNPGDLAPPRDKKLFSDKLLTAVAELDLARKEFKRGIASIGNYPHKDRVNQLYTKFNDSTFRNKVLFVKYLDNYRYHNPSSTRNADTHPLIENFRLSILNLRDLIRSANLELSQISQ
jgi:hypothetical protein